MNQDKIKEAFEEWFKTTSYYDGPGFTLHKNTQLVSWLACAEWIMSQASEGFNEWVMSEDRHGGVFENNNSFSRDEWMAERGYQQAKLSSMKELADKDSKIAELEQLALSRLEMIDKLAAIVNKDNK
jgi:hypothetical protein